MSRKVRVGLIYGGKSGEHDVSLQTALAVIKAFDHSKYEIKPFYITKQGEWLSGPALNGPVADSKELTFTALPAGEEPGSSPLAPIFAASETGEGEALDVIFPLLHGTFGEDGTVQGLLEMANIPYVGAGVLASAVGMDKVMMKKLFAQEGLPQCLFRHFTRSQWEKDQAFFLMEIEIALGYPCFVKPANLGSSVGISKASNRDELLEAVRIAFQYDRKVIVEESVDAREIEVSVLGNDEPQASVPGEIVSSGSFYDYKAKYIDGKSVMVIPAELPEETAERIRELAVQAFQAIDGTGLSRVDFFLDRQDGSIYLNEINTMPGFTPFSMYPLLWKESGKPYAQLLDELIELAFDRHADKQKLQYSFEA
ncbi:D-alanine--D-alanine ligase [Paenibacillus aurantius]|uniref:D-alanine--D-alanine ligase n=1 Tax=Paenibacillus aurantius TaxID=2918900 RepID=A0AA96RGA5_9BACL|nr:D-alanine--D-alanine ligase [Paenibacillus aurantius]WNQ12118.1 D-alanine--D-alanine ligase [Paenibacillus aurantius]